jgi:hypothetical protein
MVREKGRTPYEVREAKQLHRTRARIAAKRRDSGVQIRTSGVPRSGVTGGPPIV